MNIHNAPSWFALGILLHGVRLKPDIASCRAYWSSLLKPGDNLLCRLEAEFAEGYSGDPPEFSPKIRDFVSQLNSLGCKSLSGEFRTNFAVLAEAALQDVAMHLGLNL